MSFKPYWIVFAVDKEDKGVIANFLWRWLRISIDEHDEFAALGINDNAEFYMVRVDADEFLQEQIVALQEQDAEIAIYEEFPEWWRPHN